MLQKEGNSGTYYRKSEVRRKARYGGLFLVKGSSQVGKVLNLSVEINQ